MESIMKRFTLGIAAVTLALGGVAWAAGEAPAAPGNEKAQTRAEAQAQAEKLFAMMDANHDGKLDEADREAMRAQHEGKAFDRMDTNHDGAISRDEFVAGHAPGHKDQPKDGPPPAGGGHMRHMMMAMMIMHKADPNHTGVVGKDAFVNAALAMFDAADTNHDGTVTPEERKAAHEKMRAEMRARWGGRGDHGGHGDMPPPPPGQ
jgi:Ca2+-binding EF-hand superfamily protein